MVVAGVESAVPPGDVLQARLALRSYEKSKQTFCLQAHTSRYSVWQGCNSASKVPGLYCEERTYAELFCIGYALAVGTLVATWLILCGVWWYTRGLC